MSQQLDDQPEDTNSTVNLGELSFNRGHLLSGLNLAIHWLFNGC